MRHRKLLADYMPQIDANGRISYVYKGPEYVLEWSKKQKVLFCLFAFIVPAVGLAVFIHMGFLNADSAKQLYVMLPYISLFVPLMLLFIAMIRVSAADRVMWRQEYDRSFLYMRRCTTAAQSLTALLLIAQIAFILFSNSATEELDRAFAKDTAIIFCFLFLFRRAQARVKCKRYQ